jgi:hypothetical protein
MPFDTRGNQTVAGGEVAQAAVDQEPIAEAPVAKPTRRGGKAMKESAPGTVGVVSDIGWKMAVDAEKLLRRLAAIDRDRGGEAGGYLIPVDAGAAVVLRAAGFDPENAIALRSEFGRIESEEHWAREGGTDGELAAAEQKRDEAQRRYESEAPGIQDQLAKLHAQLDELDMAVSASQDLADAMNDARRKLLDFLPRHLVIRCETLRLEDRRNPQFDASDPPVSVQPAYYSLRMRQYSAPFWSGRAKEIAESYVRELCNSPADDSWLDRVGGTS